MTSRLNLFEFFERFRDCFLSFASFAPEKRAAPKPATTWALQRKAGELETSAETAAFKLNGSRLRQLFGPNISGKRK